MQQQPQKRIASALAAGKHADSLEHIVRLEQETSEQTAQLSLARSRRDPPDVIDNALVHIELFVLILREVIRLDLMTKLALACCRQFCSSKQFDQRRLPCSVHADQRNAIALLDQEAHVAEHFLRPVTLRYALELGDNPSA